MASFNKVILVGNLTRDPQVKYTTGGTAVTEIGLAVSRQWFDKQTNSKKEETTFVDITLWGRTAEIAGEYLAKGRPVLIEGRLQLDTWDDRETGQKRSKLRVVGENMTMLGSRSDSGGGGGSSRSSNSSSRDSGFDHSEPPTNYGSDSGTMPVHEDGPGPSGGPPTDEVPF
ncbi:MAG: single-stranded DNA-binding protein [Planctomycetes bacterium]|nr:single-stranded DNA-binding protein [Planctomycetota bacterium]